MNKNIMKITAAVISLTTLFTACAAETDNVSADTSAASITEGTVSESEVTVNEATVISDEETVMTEPEMQIWSEEPNPAEYSIASLKGPTTMGMVKLMSDSESGNTFNKYSVSVYATADEIVTGVVSGSTDIANIPANLAAVLYNKTEGQINVAAVNTLGVLYVVSSGEEISSIADLKGKTVYSTGKGTTPEYVFNYILRQNGLEPQTDVFIEYKSEASECAAVMAESENAVAVLPQPYVTAAQMQNENIKIALSLTDEWEKVCGTSLITGVTVAQSSVIYENTAAFNTFLNEYQSSVNFVNENTDEAAALIGKYDIFKEPAAKKALPYCNITLMRGSVMADTVRGYWNVLFEADPASVGGKLPQGEDISDDAPFYLGDISE